MINGREILARAWAPMRQLADILLPICILFGAVFVQWDDPISIQYLRNVTFDTYQRIQPRKFDPDLPVRIAAIDEKSLQVFGQWPWPRTTIAMLINRLHQFGAAAVAVDILLIEP